MNASGDIQNASDDLSIAAIEQLLVELEYELRESLPPLSVEENVSSAATTAYYTNNFIKAQECEVQQPLMASPTVEISTTHCKPKLNVITQPQNSMRFRYESELKKDSHGYLNGENSAGLQKNVPTVELILPFDNATTAHTKYFIRCTLHSLRTNEKEAWSISPHILCRIKDKFKNTEKMSRSLANGTYTCETDLFPMEADTSGLVYNFKLEEFLIIRTKLPTKVKDRLKIEMEKYNALQKQNKELGSKLILRTPDKNSSEKAKTTIQVQIGFEVFELVGNIYQHVAGPHFSHCITHCNGPVKIERNCNLHGKMDESTEVTLLVKGIASYDIKIRLFEESNRSEVTIIKVEKPHIHENAAITFNMPIYSGKNRTAAKVEYCIQLERSCDEMRSNIVNFTYTKSLKRQSHSELYEDDCSNNKRLATESTVSENMQHMESDSDKLTEQCFINRNMQQPPILSGSKECNDEKLLVVLKNIFLLYKKSTNVGANEKCIYSLEVRQYFESYVEKNPEGNSILHSILQYNNQQKNITKMYLIIQHFELCDLVSKSRNIYGDTALMYACIFNRTILIRALINMGTPIEAKDIEDGNNVLHLAQQQAGCVDIVMEAMRNNINAASFVEALKSYNLNGLTPLHMAVMNDNVPLVVEMLDFCKRHHALDVCECGKLSDGNTILHLAAMNAQSNAMYECILERTPKSTTDLMNFAGYTAAYIKELMDEPLLDLLVDTTQKMRL